MSPEKIINIKKQNSLAQEFLPPVDEFSLGDLWEDDISEKPEHLSTMINGWQEQTYVRPQRQVEIDLQNFV